MATEPQLELVEERPQQFGLFHLMGLMTVLAFAFALLAPLFRALSGRQVTYLLIILAIEVAVVIGSYVFSSTARRKLLSKSGRRIGQSNLGKTKTRFFGRLATVSAFFLLAIVQVGLAIMLITYTPDKFPWEMLISQIQLGFFASNALMQLRSKRDLGAIEFFENGVSLTPNFLTPWEQIIVRPSKLYDHAVNVHILPLQKHFGQSMMTVFVAEDLKQYLLKHHGDESAAAPTDNEAS